MRKSTKIIKKDIPQIIQFPDGTTMVLGQGHVPTSHEGVPAKDFSKALEKAAKAVSDAGIFDSEGENYVNRSNSAPR